MQLITKRSEKVRRNLRKYRKTKFNYENFISEYYVDDDGKAYISTKVSSLHDIISKHSIKDYEWVTPHFIHYVEDMSYYIPVEESIVLEICGHKFTEKEQALIIRILTQYFGLKLGDAIIDINIMKKKSMILLIFGIISILLFMLLNIINSFLMVIVDLRKPNLNWITETSAIKDNGNKLYQYVTTIIISLLFIYFMRIFENINIKISLCAIIFILILILLIINILVKKNINKLFEKIN